MVCIGFIVENNYFLHFKEVLFNQQTEVYRYRYRYIQKMAAFESCFHRLNTSPNQLDFEVVTPVTQYSRFGVVI